MFNIFWVNSYFPNQWKNATIIPIARPNKDNLDPNNYGPIALTSFVCKIFETMINERLIQYLEHNELIANIQCGFRSNRSILSHLIRLDTYIKQAMAEGKCMVGIFFIWRKLTTRLGDMEYGRTCTDWD